MNLLQSTIEKIVPQDASARAKARARLEQLTMPHWALGRLMDLAEDLAGMTGTMKPPVQRKVIVTMAADHGVVAEGVSLYPQEVTPQMVHNFVQGGAGINALAGQVEARVVVVDMGVAAELGDLAQKGRIISRRIGPGTKNIAQGPAMSPEEAVRCLEAGIELANNLHGEADIFGSGDMGIGNTTPSAAVAAAITERPVEEVTGRGTGLDDDQWRHKVSIIKRSHTVNRPKARDGLDVLSKVGGFELGGLAGLILGAAAGRKPILIDGFISTAGALIAKLLSPRSMDYVIASHRSAEKGHKLMLEFLQKRALLDLELRLGEGTGAALAMNLVEAAVRILTEVATFEEASVSEANQ